MAIYERQSTMHKFIIIKSKTILITALFALNLTLSVACSPHPGAGTWVTSGDNEAQFTKIIVHFEPTLEIYSTTSDKPVLYCGWSAASKQNMHVECMGSDEQKVKDIYQFKVTGETKAELIRDNKVVASFTQLPE